MADTRPIVTLTTDFGGRDPYAAEMKGVLLGAAPEARLVDLSHDIAPQCVIEGALFLATVVPRFPKGAIHLAVVDPGVGTARRPIIAELGGHFFVGPDNGLLTLLERELPLERVHVIENSAFMAPRVSPTFHGRDIFAPAAAKLALGADISEAGPATHEVARLPIPEPQTGPGAIRGEVIHVDRFGNLITNITEALLAPNGQWDVLLERKTIGPVRRTYGEVRPGEILALIGSSGRLEIAVNMGSATDRLGLGVGARAESRRPA